jgi:hypothetical protein
MRPRLLRFAAENIEAELDRGIRNFRKAEVALPDFPRSQTKLFGILLMIFQDLGNLCPVRFSNSNRKLFLWDVRQRNPFIRQNNRTSRHRHGFEKTHRRYADTAGT